MSDRPGCKPQPIGSRLQTANGFTIVELMLTMVVFVLTIAAATQVFTGLLTQFKQQSKTAETNIEGAVGLDILRQDLEHAGYGLPWTIPSGVSYSEAASSDPCGTTGTANPQTYNDSTANPPRAIVVANNKCANGSDYLVIKAVNVARVVNGGLNTASGKSTILVSTSPYVRTWTPADENLSATDRVIVVSQGTTTIQPSLIASGATFSTTYNNVTGAAWRPLDEANTYIVYGVDPVTDLRMPFNRVDYFVSTTDVPSQCASGTGTLVKAQVSHDDGDFDLPNDDGTPELLPVLDCVASLQVILQFDMNGDGTIGTQSKGDGTAVAGSESATTSTVQATLASASLIRDRLKEVRVYVLAHEGQMDMNYTFDNFTAGGASIRVGESFGGVYQGRDVNLSAIPNYTHYRWKVYTIVAKLGNLKK